MDGRSRKAKVSKRIVTVKKRKRLGDKKTAAQDQEGKRVRFVKTTTKLASRQSAFRRQTIAAVCMEQEKVKNEGNAKAAAVKKKAKKDDEDFYDALASRLATKVKESMPEG